MATCGAPMPVASPSNPPPPAPSPPAPTPQEPTATLTCDVRATDAVAIKGVKATVKGRSEPLDAQFSAFDARNQSLSVLYLIQIVDPARQRTAAQMADAVIKMSDLRDGKRRYAAYSMANDLNLVADFSASKADFDKQVRSIRPAALPTQLYKAALEAVAKLAKEQGDRKVLIILGDGNSDDTSYTHELVVKAAKDANIVIHALGYTEDVSDLPKFQQQRRLAEETGGFRREAKVGRELRYTPTSKFVSDVLENGGTVKVNLKEPGGPTTLTLTAELANGRFESADHSFTMPAPPAPPPAPTPPPDLTPPTDVDADANYYQRVAKWVRTNTAVAMAIGAGFALAAIGFLLFAISHKPASGAGAALTDKQGRQVVYGWLEMLDGNASRYPLRTTNVRIGRHRDNDVCLQNDSISRRHALLHFNADNRHFVITDLGGGNGVVVNKVRQKTHELKDGDLVELGEVRLRFRANKEFLG